MAARERSRDQHSVNALNERETPLGWRFEIEIGQEASETTQRVDAALSWVDYEYWSHGAASPSRVAETVVRAMLASDALDKVPEWFDCSTARRWVRDLDQRVRDLL